MTAAGAGGPGGEPSARSSWSGRLAGLVASLRSVVAGLPYYLSYRLYETVAFGLPHRLDGAAGAGRRAIVVLNGASLAELSPESLADGDIFVCNDFCRTPFFEALRPRYYVLADQQYYAGSITASGRPVRAESLEILNRRAAWPIRVFLPLDARREGLSAYLGNPLLERLHFSKAPLPGEGRLSRWMLYRTGAMPYVANVSVAMIALAVKLGYRRIDVFGLDMSFYRYFRVDRQNLAHIGSSYFYEHDKVEPYMISAKTEGGYVRGNARIFFERMFQTIDEHWKIAAMTRGRTTIVNHSGDSVIDCYERGER